MTAFPGPSIEPVTSAFRTSHLPAAGPRHATPSVARHRAPETGEIRIVAAADCARQGRHAAAEDADLSQDPLGWLGLRFTSD